VIAAIVVVLATGPDLGRDRRQTPEAGNG
jgi:hypothetical protein